MSGQTPTPETISCEEARGRLGMGRDAFFQAVEENKVPGFYMVGRYYFGIRAAFEAVVVHGQPIPTQRPTEVPPPVPIPFVTRRSERTG